MQLCQRHWEIVLKRVENPLFVNLLIMQKLVDQYSGDIYKLQSEKSGGCPICFLEKTTGKGEDLLEAILAEVSQ